MGKRVRLFVGFALLVVIGLLGITILVKGQNTEWPGSTTLFLPVVFQTESSDNPDASDSFIQWNRSQAPYQTAAGQAVVAEVDNQEYLYLFGGGNTFGNKNQIVRTDRATHAEIHPDGSLGEWSGTNGSSLPDLTPLPLALYGFTATAVHNNIYLIGGYYYKDGSAKLNQHVYCAPLGADGSIQDWEKFDAWQPQTVFDALDYKHGVSYHATVVVKDRIYIIGGTRVSNFNNNPWEPTLTYFPPQLGTPAVI